MFVLTQVEKVISIVLELVNDSLKHVKFELGINLRIMDQSKVIVRALEVVFMNNSGHSAPEPRQGNDPI